jgi:uncharacterized membrane protein
VTRWFYASIALTLLALAASLYLWFFQYDALPEQLPSHWNAAGQPDAFTSKHDILGTFLLLPLIMVGILVLTPLLPWLSPKHFEIDRFRQTYGYIMFLVTGLCGYIHLAILLGSLSVRVDTTKLVLGGICLFFAALGNVMGKVRRNFYVGVRTPWTLASDAVWESTHRLAAWLMVAGGILAFIGIVAGIPFYWCFIGLMIMILIPVPYSLILYKRLERQGKLSGPEPSNSSQEVHAS